MKPLNMRRFVSLNILTHTSKVVTIGRLRDVFWTAIVTVSETMSKSDNMREPLLQSPQQASMTEANRDR
jgi:hypothetical protein